MLEKRDFTATAMVEKPLPEVFNHLTRDVSKWWGGRDFHGNSMALDDEFIIHHPGAHFSRQKLVEVVPDKKIVWLVTESKLDWLEKNKAEWTGTKMIFELETRGSKTVINFTHEGLVPGKECYEKVSQGWNMVITTWLVHFITTGESKIP